jgi:hypothetical protein
MEIFFFTTFGKAFVPKKLRPYLHFYFEKTGADSVPYHAFGVLFWIGVVLTYALYMTQIFPLLQERDPVIFFVTTIIVWTAIMLGLLFILGMIWYFYLNLKIYDRTKQMEARLPDYLTLVSTSLKGGYSFEKALWGAIKPEFGILATEIGLVSKKVMTGNDVADALNEFALKYQSPILRRSINLIIGELESGGKIADVIDRVIINLKKTKSLKEEMAASTLTYMIFISSLVMFVMPVLFALSFVLFNVITSFLTNISTTMTNTPTTLISLSKPSININDYKIFMVLSISIISVASGGIISVIEKGSLRSGIKYIPMYWVVSLVMYFLSMTILSAFFGNMIPTG